VKIFENKRKILIKTYTFESGLWYLSLSLYKKLLGEGHEVYFVPKSKYTVMANMYERHYPDALNKPEFDNKPILKFSEDKDIVSQMLNMITKYEIDTVISFETLMEKSSWIMAIKNKKSVKVIDIPMIEWVSPKFLNGKSYYIFDEVWCLTDLCFDHFKGYGNIKRMSWEFADSQLFNKIKSNKTNKHIDWLNQDSDIKFLHFASLNPQYSSKNTEETIKAFLEFSNDKTNKPKLLVVGKKTEQNKFLLEQRSNISFTDQVMSIEDIALLYKSSDVLLMPSTKEGLGMSLFQAEACGLEIITTDAKPMNEIKTKYLCSVDRIKNDGTLIPKTESNKDSILKQIKICCEDINVCRD
jgi:glycosyltransferase involved in cell wall biosynthesis